VSPYDAVEWETRTASISSEKGEIIFEQKDVEVPRSWSQTATNIVVSKYFHGQIGTPGRERSVRQLVDRVARTITEWGRKGGYFASLGDAQIFHDELAFLLLNQYASFNSPVWFNCGIEPQPQCSACFINSIEDRRAPVQMGFRYGNQPVAAALLPRQAFPRRHCFGPGKLHEGL